VHEAVDTLSTAEEALALKTQRDKGFWANENLGPFVEEMVSYTFSSIFPPRPVKGDHRGLRI